MHNGGWAVATFGLSPRMRRTLAATVDCRQNPRFISASAENTTCHRHAPAFEAVYLRGCGERHKIPDRIIDLDGLSPRMRRTRANSNDAVLICRFISADAENASSICVYVMLPSVYLRGCGERDKGFDTICTALDLSPRMRRTLKTVIGRSISGRFISASAENA